MQLCTLCLSTGMQHQLHVKHAVQRCCCHNACTLYFTCMRCAGQLHGRKVHVAKLHKNQNQGNILHLGSHSHLLMNGVYNVVCWLMACLLLLGMGWSGPCALLNCAQPMLDAWCSK